MYSKLNRSSKKRTIDKIPPDVGKRKYYIRGYYYEKKEITLMYRN